MKKEHLPIVRSFDPKKGIIRYHMKDGRLNLPNYDNLVVDGLKVRIRLVDIDQVRHLPDLNKGYTLKEANKFEIVFVQQ